MMDTKSLTGRGLVGIPVLILVVSLIALTIGLGYIFYKLYRDAEYDRAGTQMAAEVRTLMDELSRTAPQAALGDAHAGAVMADLRSRMAAIWTSIDGNLAEQLPAEQVSAFATEWAEAQRQLDVVTLNSQNAQTFRPAVAKAQEMIPEFKAATANLGKILVTARASPAEIDAAYSLATGTDQIEASIAALLDADRRVANDFAALQEQRQRFSRLLEGLRSGDPALGLVTPRNTEVRYQLATTADRYRGLNEALEGVGALIEVVMVSQAAADAIAGGSSRLATLADDLADQIRALRVGGGTEVLPGISITELAILGVGLLVAGLAAMGFLLMSDARRRLRATAADNQANQDAILRLLNEIEGLAEGDLTVQATVTGDFTGAIADAINYAIQQLRELVARIEEVSTDVSAASDQTRTTALELSTAAESQARETASASAAISEMAITIDQVSANATESAAVAERSVSIAGQGATVVQNTIAGMDRIREQIQETAKRIKRLGESSQEIGDIVSLIGDIAEQTNILALNAAIQASMAGDAGRGFAVVADEVQRLAERSAGAAKQVATLVAAIQADTGAAVASMEQTTAEVVSGAALSQDAGVALGQIEAVSTDLAELIQDISTAARHQSSTAGHISNTMNVIQGITSSTLDQANRTAASIGELADMAVELRQSVSGFRLPDALRASGNRRAPDRGFQRGDTGAAGPLAITPPEPGAAKTPQPHIAAVLAESSAMLDAIDRKRGGIPEVAEPRPLMMDDFADDDSGAAHLPHADSKVDWPPTLAAELAEVDLDEFDLDRGDARR